MKHRNLDEDVEVILKRGGPLIPDLIPGGFGEGVIYLRGLSKDVRDNFSAACRRRGSTMAAVLRAFIKRYVRDSNTLPIRLAPKDWRAKKSSRKKGSRKQKWLAQEKRRKRSWERARDMWDAQFGHNAYLKKFGPWKPRKKPAWWDK